jgi:[acyl-carrier-protein] S-malonyltransferase
MALAFVFPGQGSQSVGMLGELAAQYPIVRRTYDEAAEALGYDLWALTAAGPAEQLNGTECTQPAMLAAGIATWRVWKEQGGPAPAMVAGHSLGEYTALVCAGALRFAPALALVRERGRLMQAAVPPGQGAMAAILGLDDEAVEASCQEAAQGATVEAVNYNAPGQVVIAGEARAVERAMAVAKGRGAKRCVLLPVSVPAHSSLLGSAEAQFRSRLAELGIEAPGSRYFSAVDAAEHGTGAGIRAILERQLASPVRWTSTVRALTAAGAKLIIECGPGKVLTALNRRIDRGPDVDCMAVEDGASLQLALAAAEGKE